FVRPKDCGEGLRKALTTRAVFQTFGTMHPNWPLWSGTACLAFLAGLSGPVQAAEKSSAAAETRAGVHSFSVREYGARGDGVSLDTAFINRAIEACAEVGGGQVRFPAGRYLSGTIHLHSHVVLFLEAGAVLLGTTNLEQYAQPEIPSSMPEA